MGEREPGGGGRGRGRSRFLLLLLLLLLILLALGALLILRPPWAEEILGGLGVEVPELGIQPPPEELPPPPSHIRGDMDPVYDIPVDWNDNSDNEDGFNIYHRRIDILSAPMFMGEVGEDETHFLDTDVFCGATYQYTIASFNALGESPATECWEITLPDCPTPRVMRLRVGEDYGRNFLSGELGEHADFYLMPDDTGRMMFMADMEGQFGLLDLGDIGTTPLHRVTLPDPANYERNGVPAILGHTYVAMARDGRSLIIFTLNRIGDPSTLTYIIFRPWGEVIEGWDCRWLGGRTPGGPCVSGDGVCDPTCVEPDPGMLGEPVPDDAPDDFGVDGPEEEVRGRSTWLAKPVCIAVLEPIYTPEDEDCDDLPCITGDDICNEPCGSSEEAMLAEGYFSGTDTSDQAGSVLDGDCGDDPCVWGDGICDPICEPAPMEPAPMPGVAAAAAPCIDTNGDGEADGCYDEGQQEPPPGDIVPAVATVIIDEDCGGPCENDGICDPLCDPYYDPTNEVDQPYDPDCDDPCDPGDDPCECLPTTETADEYTAAELEELCGDDDCPLESPCYGMYPQSECITPDGTIGICQDCECVPDPGGACTLGDGVVNPGESCDNDANCPSVYTCDPAECLCFCPADTPCAGLPFNAHCVDAAGTGGYCQADCSCLPESNTCTVGDDILNPGETCDADADCPPNYACDPETCTCRCSGQTATCFGMPQGAQCIDAAGSLGYCEDCQCYVPGGSCVLGDVTIGQGENCDSDDHCPAGSVCSPVDCTCVCQAPVGAAAAPDCWSPLASGVCMTPLGEPGFCQDCTCIPSQIGGLCVVGDGVTNPGEECDSHDDCAVGTYCSSDDCMCRCGGDSPCTWPSSTGTCTIPGAAADVTGVCRNCECVPPQTGGGCVVGDGAINAGEECDSNAECGDNGFCDPADCLCYCESGPCGTLSNTGSCTTDSGAQGFCQRCACVEGGGGAGNCGDLCSDTAPCGVVDGIQLSCFNGVCWDDCACEGQCGEPGEPGGGDGCHECRDDSGCVNYCGATQGGYCGNDGCCHCR
jgi:hypothetical protein